MKKGYTLIVFFLISTLYSYSQISTSNQIIINKSAIEKSTSASNDYTLKLSSIEASDYGWTSQNSGTTNDISCVHFINENEGWATVPNQGLLHTIDGGDSWSFINMGGWDADFNHVYFLNSCDGWLSGDRTFIRTMNFCNTWEGFQYNSSYRYRNASFPLNNSLIWIIGGALEPNCEHFFHRYNFHGDGSAGYYAQTYFGQCSIILKDIYMANDSIGWVVGTPGKIWKITRASADPEITEQISGTDLSLNSVFMLNQELGWIVGENGTILKNIGGDSVWVSHNSGITNNLNAVSFIDSINGIAVGDSGIIIRTTDGGLSWTNEVSGITNNFKSVFFITSTTAYAVGENGIILKYLILQPDIPTLSSPSDGATDQALSLSLDWGGVTGAESYSLQVSAASDFSSTVVNESGITSTSKEISGLANSTPYYWRVNATNAGGTSGWSEAWNFTTIPALPAIPVLSDPSNGSTNQALALSLNWNAANRAESYALQVSAASDFISTVVNESGITSTSKEISGLVNSTPYYWRVNATNAGGTSGWSEVWNFTTENIVGLNEFSFDEKVKLFPNPANNVLHFEGIENEVTNVSLLSMDGKLLIQLNKNGITQINVSDLPNGIYLVKIQNSKFMITKKIVKQ